MDGIESLVSRPVIIGGAVGGALIAILGPMALRKIGVKNPQLLSTVGRLGYALSWISVGLFIVAGFLSNY